jgi:hypothetical protein
MCGIPCLQFVSHCPTGLPERSKLIKRGATRSIMGNRDETPLGPLVGLVERLRGEMVELQGRWEALGEELETQRRRLRLAEATVELMQRRQKEKAPQEQDDDDSHAEEERRKAAGMPCAEKEEQVSQPAQASVGF